MRITQIKETCLYATNLDEVEKFYAEKMNLPVISRVGNRHVFFRAGRSVLLFFNPDKTKFEETLPPHYAEGPQHIAFEVPADQYQQYKNRVKTLGIKITHLQDWKNGEMESFYFEDPAGNVLEVVPEGLWE